ncbi:helix-turn-helix transcriptional regulator [Nonomuraea endophytica]|uniref:Putative DNA-binding transcriptional regulator YafY n=1 Tax=Nonomuraea endophytica TaxID=714136 RepID=A0A7W7ZWA8_9ACTN|nr:HTH domain-containing protein [Nonomuraea endophytica]MBB5074953.1 putative DNA-binding transcriptional regulator YafY [Nonomuraea endophytica]
MLISIHALVPRVERQHRLIEELRATAPRALTAGSLARRLGVSARTIERDLADLMEAGVPVVSQRGPGGGYAIDARSVLPPLTFTPGEASALVASLAAVGPRSSASAQRALAKLIDALCRDGAP